MRYNQSIRVLSAAVPHRSCPGVMLCSLEIVMEALCFTGMGVAGEDMVLGY